MRRTRILAVIIVAVMGLVMCAIIFLNGRASTDYAPVSFEEQRIQYASKDNRFPEIEQLAKEIQTGSASESVPNPEIGDDAVLNQSQAPDAEFVSLIRSALDSELIIPPVFDFASDAEGALAWHRDMEVIAKNLKDEGDRFLDAGDVQGAIDTYFCLLDLAEAVSQGGVLMTSNLFTSTSFQGLYPTHQLLPTLDIEQLAYVQQELEQHINEIPPFESFVANEREMIRESDTQNFMQRFVTERFIFAPARESMRDGYERSLSIFLGTDLRARVLLYQAEHGSEPENLQLLFPDGGTVPIDPATGNQFQIVNGKIFSTGERTMGRSVNPDSMTDGSRVF
ncbi:MAG: hypothetical protein VCD00_01625 [Candidatus Hydrogenedentota bacterium]